MFNLVRTIGELVICWYSFIDRQMIMDDSVVFVQ